MSTERIYIQLLDEGTWVCRPTQGEVLGNSLYRVLAIPNYDPEDEVWEFLPGTIVRCRLTTTPSEKKTVLLAYEEAKMAESE